MKKRWLQWLAVTLSMISCLIFALRVIGAIEARAYLPIAYPLFVTIAKSAVVLALALWGIWWLYGFVMKKLHENQSE